LNTPRRRVRTRSRKTLVTEMLATSPRIELSVGGDRRVSVLATHARSQSGRQSDACMQTVSPPTFSQAAAQVRAHNTSKVGVLCSSAWIAERGTSSPKCRAESQPSSVRVGSDQWPAGSKPHKHIVAVAPIENRSFYEGSIARFQAIIRQRVPSSFLPKLAGPLRGFGGPHFVK